MFVTKYYCKNTLMDTHSYCIIMLPLSASFHYIHVRSQKSDDAYLFNYVNLFSHAFTHSSLNLIHTQT